MLLEHSQPPVPPHPGHGAKHTGCRDAAGYGWPREKDGTLWVVVAVPCQDVAGLCHSLGPVSTAGKALHGQGLLLLGAVPASQLHVKHQMAWVFFVPVKT